MIRPKGGKGGTGNHQPGGLSREKREECIPDRTQEGVQKRETDSREELDVREAEALTETGAQGIQTPIGAECTERCGEGQQCGPKACRLGRYAGGAALPKQLLNPIKSMLS